MKSSMMQATHRGMNQPSACRQTGARFSRIKVGTGYVALEKQNINT